MSLRCRVDKPDVLRGKEAFYGNAELFEFIYISVAADECKRRLRSEARAQCFVAVADCSVVCRLRILGED